jgi:8-oxo-dGTP pyrophosphatase MutT (NUDIX family)
MPHINEKIDYTVEVFIVYKNKVLLRMHDKHNIWLSVGGHIELDEDPVTAAIREVKEEVGLEIKIVESTKIPEDVNYKGLINPKFLGMHKVNDVHSHIVFVYFATSNTDQIIDSVNEHEKSETCWCTMEEIKEMDLRPNIKFYASEALKELSF